MAAGAWAYGILGLFLAWIVFVIVAQSFGFITAILNDVQQRLENQSITIPQEFTDLRNTITNFFTSIWGWLGIIVFFSFIIYIIINSMRKQPSDIWV